MPASYVAHRVAPSALKLLDAFPTPLTHGIINGALRGWLNGIALDLIAETSRSRKRVLVDRQRTWLQLEREFINDEFANL